MKKHPVRFQKEVLNKEERDEKLQAILQAGQFYQAEDPVVEDIHKHRYYLVTRYLLGECAMRDENNLSYTRCNLFADVEDYVYCGRFSKFTKGDYWEPSQLVLSRRVVWDISDAPTYITFKEPNRSLMFNKLLDRGLKLENAAKVNSQAAEMLKLENYIVSPEDLYREYTKAVRCTISEQESMDYTPYNKLKINNSEPLDSIPTTWTDVYNYITEVGVSVPTVAGQFKDVGKIYRSMGYRYVVKLCTDMGVSLDDACKDPSSIGIRMKWLPTKR